MEEGVILFIIRVDCGSNIGLRLASGYTSLSSDGVRLEHQPELLRFGRAVSL